MKIEEAFASCEAKVRRFDPDRYFASLFAPAAVRPHLFALYAFNYEVANIGEHAREPMMAAVRLQWWREAVAECCDGRPRAHPVTIGLAELFARPGSRLELFEALLDARDFDASPDLFADLPALESYCDATSVGLMKIAARVLGGQGGEEEFVRHAGVAYALAGLLRAIPFHASRGKVYLPLDHLANEKLSPDDVFVGRERSTLKRIISTLAIRARGHIEAVRRCKPDSANLLASLPSAIVPLHVRQLVRQTFDPYRDPIDVPLFRKQIALARAAIFGRL